MIFARSPGFMHVPCSPTVELQESILGYPLFVRTMHLEENLIGMSALSRLVHTERIRQ